MTHRSFPLLLLAFIFPAHSAMADERGFAVGPTPDWYQPLPLEEILPEKTPNTGATRYLLLDTQSAILPEGESLVHRRVSQPLTPGGVSDVSEITINFDPVYQKLILNYVHIIRDGQVLNRLDPKDVRILQREPELDSLVYDGSLTAFLLLEDVRPGDVLDFAFTRIGSNPVFGGSYFGSFSMGWSTAVDRRRVVIHNFDSRVLRQQVLAADFAADTLPHGTHRDLVLDRHELVAREGEDYIPKWERVWPQFQVSEYPDWAAVADWADKLYAPALQSADVHELAERLAGNATDNADYARDALRFVQEEVRYFGVEFGTNSHAPSKPAETLRRRYGDCKDKTALLVALLRAHGLNAHPALVSIEWGRGISESLPSPGAFDHVIVTLQLNGRRYWMDPTALYQAGTLKNMSTPGFGKALIISEDTRALVDIKKPRRLEPSVEIEESYVLDKDGHSAILTVTTQYRESEANEMRATLADTPISDFEEDYLSCYREQYSAIELHAGLHIKDDHDANLITIVESYQIPDFLKANDKKKSFEIFTNAFDGYLNIPDEKERRYPYAVQDLLKVEHVAHITYYKDIDWETEVPLKIETPTFKYRFTASERGRTLSRHHILIMRRDYVEPEEMGEYVADMNRIYDQLSYTAEISSGSGWDNLFEAYTKALNNIFGK